jgi:hypothetical protein
MRQHREEQHPGNPQPEASLPHSTPTLCNPGHIHDRCVHVPPGDQPTSSPREGYSAKTSPTVTPVLDVSAVRDADLQDQRRWLPLAAHRWSRDPPRSEARLPRPLWDVQDLIQAPGERNQGPTTPARADFRARLPQFSGQPGRSLVLLDAQVGTVEHAAGPSCWRWSPAEWCTGSPVSVSS